MLKNLPTVAVKSRAITSRITSENKINELTDFISISGRKGKTVPQTTFH